jgi:RNA polymerase sigma-70 factor (ECF subfamily)
MKTVTSDAAATPESLLVRFRATREPDALGALFDATAPTLLRVALSIAPDAASAENALQETFLAVLEAPERWDESRPVMPWLLGILHRQVGKIRRDGARRPDPLRVAPPLRDDDPSAAAMSREEMDRARAAIDELPEPYRVVAVLRWRHGLDPAEIADVRGEPPGTSRSLLSRALEKLRARLGGAALALFGVPTTRGLDGVRRALMSRAAAATSAVGTTVVVGGAIVMNKIVAACVALALVGGGTWWAATRTTRSPVATTSRAGATATSVSTRRSKQAADADSAHGGAVPPPVDLDKCDRDLDLFGRVIDEDGKPVANADVATARYPWRSVPVQSIALWYEIEDGPASRTAIDGTFAVRLERGAKLDLRVAAHGFGDVVREDCQAGERVEITLRRGATLDVTTVDEAGAPVAGVTVKVRGSSMSAGPLKQRREGVTDAAGHVALAGMLPGQVYIDYLHPTLGGPKVAYATIPAAGTLSVGATMRAGRTLTGRVTDVDTGKPIAGALVDCFNFTRPVTTDADGRYVLHGWTYDDSSYFQIEAKVDGYCAVYREVPPSGDVDIAMHVGDRVVGRLIRDDGTPVADAYVGVYGSVPERGPTGRSMRPSDSDAARTAADGRFDLGKLSRDISHVFVAVAPGLARTAVDFDRHFWTGNTIDLGDIVMTASRSIEGVAVDVDGKTVSDATVTISDPDFVADRPGSFLHRRQRRTDDLGRFRFSDLAPGKYVAVVRATNSPEGPATSIALHADRDVLDARVTLGGSRSLTVLVVDDLDAPLADMRVATDVNLDSKTNGLLSVSTGLDGRATFRGIGAVPSSTYVWVNQPDGTGGGRFGPYAIDGKEVRVVLRRTVEIRGVIHGEDGKPFASYVKATLHRDGSDAGSGSSDETGEFAMKVPLGEVVDLWVRGTIPDAHGQSYTGFEGRANGVAGPKDGVEIVLRPVKTTYDRALVVVVQDSTGVPYSGVEIGIYEPPKSWKLKTDADGRARFEGLPSHELCLNFADLDTSPPQHAMDVAPGLLNVMAKGQEIVVKYRAGAAIHGRVVDAKGRGVADAYVGVTTSDGKFIQSRGDADGRFTTYGLPGLAHRIMAQGFVDGAASGGEADKIVPGDAEVVITVTPRTK